MKLPNLALPILAVAVLAAPAAQAQSSVTIYGLIDATVRYANNVSASGGSDKSVGDGAYTGSRLGFRATEDLGGGLKAMFTIEQGLDPSTGELQQATSTSNYGQSAAPNGRAWGRQAFVRLSSEYGTLTLGRQYTIAHELSGRFQPMSNVNLDALSIFSGHHVAREDNMVKYVVKLGPVGLGANAVANEGNGHAWGLSGAYTAGAFDLVAYLQRMQSANQTETRKITGVGGAYKAMSGLTLYLGGMQRRHELSAQKNTVLAAGANYNLTDKLMLTASFARDRQSGLNEGSRKLMWFGADYQFSKRTDVYVEVDRNSVSGSYPLPSFMGTRDDQTGTSVGVRHRF